jgi:glucose dehydrogenase
MQNTTNSLTPRFVARKGRGHWYVLDRTTGEVRTGFVYVGAVQVADHLNRRNP